MVEVSKAIDLASHVLNLAKTCGVSLKAYEVGLEHMKAAQSHAGPSTDILGIYGAVRLESDLPFENL